MEIWKDYNEYYEVSSFGNVRSKTRIVNSTFGGTFVKEGRVLKQNDNGQGYLQVTLCNNGASKSERVHRLVALTFLDNPDNLPKVNHKDANKRNNHVDNLEWCTQLENVIHAVNNGLFVVGSARVGSKLTDNDVMDIKLLMKNGFSNKEIAELFNVHSGTINCIRTGRNWSHIEI